MELRHREGSHPGSRAAKEVKCPASCPAPAPAAPAQEASLVLHLLHPVLRPSELSEDVRENPKSD